MAGVTRSCVRAVSRLLACGEVVESAKLLTHDRRHGFVLITRLAECIAILPGFTSGYSGEGPSGLARVLALLESHGTEIDEYFISSKMFHRLEKCCLLASDVEWLESERASRPMRWSDYIYAIDPNLSFNNESLVSSYPRSLPLGLIDDRILDLARGFDDNPGHAIDSAYRRLEDLVRSRAGLKREFGAKLFSKAFIGENAPLRWEVEDKGEQQGRGQLFSATFMAFRNARAHREALPSDASDVHEFLLINHLFYLERSASKFEGRALNA
mgnify:CR=1 FL=1